MTSTFGCPHCGKSNPIDAQFCSFCGTVLSNVESSLRSQRLNEVDADDCEEIETDANEAGPDDEGLSEAPPQDSHDTPLPNEDEDVDTNDVDNRHEAPVPPPSFVSPAIEVLEKSDADLALQDDMAVWLERFPVMSVQPAAPLGDDMRRQLRQMFGADVPLTDVPTPSRPPDGIGLFRLSWIYWLVAGGLILALLFGGDNSESPPHAWPGLLSAYEAIETMPSGATVLVDWAYDPSTAGEMDLVARPVIEHLLTRNANLVVISQLPLGPATARRLIAGADETGRAGIARRLDTLLVEGGFLPGGAATLSLLGQAPGVGLPVDMQGRSAAARPSLEILADRGPVLSFVFAYRSEAVQRWLEQVQPQNGAPVIAVTSAAAGPVLYPYLDSGQLVGLVSGYNGGIGYQALLLRALSGADQQRLWHMITGQNWALIILLVVIVLANVALSLDRRMP